MKKKIITDGRGNAIDTGVKVKRKPPEKYIYPQWMLDMWRERDRVIWKTADEETKKALRERYGLDGSV